MAYCTNAHFCTQKRQVAIIDLKEDQTLPVPIDDPLLINHMLQYLYSLDYLEELEQEQKLPGKPRKKGILWAGEEPSGGEEWTKSSRQEGEYSTEIAPGRNARIHAQIYKNKLSCLPKDCPSMPRERVAVAFQNIYNSASLLRVGDSIWMYTEWQSQIVTHNSGRTTALCRASSRDLVAR